MVGLEQVALLKGVIADEPKYEISHKHRRKQIDKLMVQLQSKKKMWWFRDKQGKCDYTFRQGRTSFV